MTLPKTGATFMGNTFGMFAPTYWKINFSVIMLANPSLTSYVTGPPMHKVDEFFTSGKRI